MNRWLRILAVLCGLGCSIAQAQVPWKSETYHLEANRQPIDELLRQFGADQSVSIVVSEKVTGTVSGTFTNLTPQKFLEQITAANGLIWYHDGHSIYVYRADEVTTAMFTLRFITTTKVKESLSTLGVTWTAGSLKSIDEDQIIYAIGPPRYLELVAQTIQTLEEVATQRTGGEYETQVFPLKYAWADDQTFFFTDTRVTVPGIATTLRSLETQQNTGAQSGTGNMQELPNTLTKLRGQGLIAAGRPPTFTLPGAAINQAGPPPPGGVRDAVGPSVVPVSAVAATAQDAQSIGTAYIASDTRINAVIVRDLREKMVMYKTVIEQLDQPVGLVQISASIIDVDRDYSYSFGPPYDFQLRDKAGDFFQFGLDVNPADSPNLTATFVKNGAVQFLSRMRALEAAGKANIVSQPSVLTLNNVEANLSATDTFFVRVAGNREVDLFNVSVGVTLRIIPHIVEDVNGRSVKLIIRLEDGVLKDEQVDDIPVVRRSSINTQAVLHDEESLLIGGLYNEREVQIDRGIPVLGRIPKLGFLFRSTETERRRSERMVLITPRVVELNVNQNLPLPLTPPYPIPCMADIPQPWPHGYPPCLDKAAAAPALARGLYIPPGQAPPVLLDPVDPGLPGACPPGGAMPAQPNGVPVVIPPHPHAMPPTQPGPVQPRLPEVKDPPDLPPPEANRLQPRGTSPALEAVRKQSPNWVSATGQRNITITRVDPQTQKPVESPKATPPVVVPPPPKEIRAPVKEDPKVTAPVAREFSPPPPPPVRPRPAAEPPRTPPSAVSKVELPPDASPIPVQQATPPVQARYLPESQAEFPPTASTVETPPAAPLIPDPQPTPSVQARPTQAAAIPEAKVASPAAAPPIPVRQATPSVQTRHVPRSMPDRVEAHADEEAQATRSGMRQALLNLIRPKAGEPVAESRVEQARYSVDPTMTGKPNLEHLKRPAGQPLSEIPGSRQVRPATRPSAPMTFSSKPKVHTPPPACRKL